MKEERKAEFDARHEEIKQRCMTALGEVIALAVTGEPFDRNKLIDNILDLSAENVVAHADYQIELLQEARDEADVGRLTASRDLLREAHDDLCTLGAGLDEILKQYQSLKAEEN